MSFQPVLVGSGLSGWQFLQATQARQRAVFDRSPDLKRDTDHFKAKIATVRTVDDLMQDRRLLRVALGAFGLQDDINNAFFIRKVLQDGTTRSDALANKLADDRYKAFSKAFSFDSPVGPRTGRSSFGTDMVARYRAQQFEIAVGSQDETLRLALNFERALPEIAASDGGADAKWFRVMGTPPIRSVIETALGLPKGFGRLDIDKQLEMFRDKMQARFGVREIDELVDRPVMKNVVLGYLVKSQIDQGTSFGTGQVALSLLQSFPKRGGP